MPSPLRSRRSFLKSSGAVAALAAVPRAWGRAPSGPFNVRSYGAKGDGTTLDTQAFQAAIAAADAAGGGTVEVPAGRYLCTSIKLCSNLTLHFAAAAVVIAATPNFTAAGAVYDPPEPQSPAAQPYQDFGHNHWHNSLFWGEHLDNLSLIGPGELWGRGLEHGDGPAEERPGAGNKTIALKLSRNVLLRDLVLREAGHFGVLATGVDNLTLEDLRIDTRRDGIDIDCCRNVHIRGCTVNSPWDDAIVLKSSFALGVKRSTEQVTISDCTVTGSYELGSMLAATDLPVVRSGPNGWPAKVGRIKIGTETVGDVRNIVVDNCIFDGCHGLAVISEDGGIVEDVMCSNITMRNTVGPPLFVRLGGRMREPQPASVSIVRRIGFHAIDCVSATAQNCSVIAGIPGHNVEDIVVTGLRVLHPGGGHARTTAVPEALAAYPEPEMFGPTPAHGLYLRHATQLDLRDILVTAATPDQRPLVFLEDAHQVWLADVRCASSGPAAIQSSVQRGPDCSAVHINP